MTMDSFSDDGGIKELYRSFVEAVERDGDLSSFSEDDLIDIFDYVTGIPDDFIAGESLRVGERLYPDSVGLSCGIRSVGMIFARGCSTGCRPICSCRICVCPEIICPQLSLGMLLERQ